MTLLPIRVIRSKLKTNVRHIYSLRHFKKLIKIPGLNHQAIGTKFIDLIDEGVKNYALFQQTQNLDELLTWAS